MKPLTPLTKKEKMLENKKRLVSLIVEDLKANEFESRSYIYALVTDSLMNRTQADLKQIIKGN